MVDLHSPTVQTTCLQSWGLFEQSLRVVALTLLLFACDAGQRPPTGPRPDQVAQAEIDEARTRAQHEIDAVAKAVLERFAREPQTMPDYGLLEHQTTILVDRDLDPMAVGAIQLTADALPTGAFALRTDAEMQAQADRTHETVTYVFLYGLEIQGNRATFSVGVQVKVPDVPEGSGTCCCSESDVFVKTNGTWTYSETTDSICS
jgi:hypothetical protein